MFTLYPQHAPLTVESFVQVARSGFFDGLGWCRIVRDYVIQSGSPDNDIMTAGFDILDAIAEMETSGPDTWNKPLVMPMIGTIEIIS